MYIFFIHACTMVLIVSMVFNFETWVWKLCKRQSGYTELGFYVEPYLKADFQSSHAAPRSSLRVHAWALTSNHNAKQLILIRCKGASCEDWKSAFTPCTSFVLGLLIFKYHGWTTELKRCYWMIRSLYWNTMCSLTVHRAQNCINANKKI
jgi:hypothetical protein